MARQRSKVINPGYHFALGLHTLNNPLGLYYDHIDGGFTVDLAAIDFDVMSHPVSTMLCPSFVFICPSFVFEEEHIIFISFLLPISFPHLFYLRAAEGSHKPKRTPKATKI